MSRSLSPVLLVGAGAGEATCGILYLASYLRRHDVEAYVRLYDGDVTDGEVRQSIERLVARVRPKVLGISLKWFHHLHRALQIARIVRSISPDIRIVVGGNTAAHFWRELHALDLFDDLVLGDGERPLLEICQGVESPANVVTRNTRGQSTRLPLKYIQSSANTDDVHYSHFSDIFLSQQDLHAFSGWVAPGKGCAENCLYCGGARGNQKAAFGRAKPFLRSEKNVRLDHQEIAPLTWQMRYDFSGSTAAFLDQSWAGVDLGAHCCTYFLWGLPRFDLIESLTRTFGRVFMVLDIGCFSQTQRLEQMQRGLLKPCAKDDELLALLDDCRRFSNLDIEVSGIGGLPFANAQSLREELALVDRVIEQNCVIGYQRLESQPGALVTAHPERFGMSSEASGFDDFLAFFDQREAGDNSVPMIRFLDEELEDAVQETSDEVDARAWAHRDAKRAVRLDARTRLQNTAPSTKVFSLGEWLGSHRVPTRFAREEVTVIRSVDGIGINCAPTVNPRKFSEPTITPGEDGGILLAALKAFSKPLSVTAGIQQLGRAEQLDPQTSREVIEHLVDGRFLQPV